MATQVVGSKFPSLASDQLKPSKEGYGQNNFRGASSDMPGENTRSGFRRRRQAAILAAALTAVNPKDALDPRGRSGKGNPPTGPKGGDTSHFAQTRPVKADSYPLSFGMDKRSSRKN